MPAIAIKYLLEKEITKLNKMIDEKIRNGKPYKREAQIHKKLVRKLRHLRNRKSPSLSFLFL